VFLVFHSCLFVFEIFLAGSKPAGDATCLKWAHVSAPAPRPQGAAPFDPDRAGAADAAAADATVTTQIRRRHHRNRPHRCRHHHPDLVVVDVVVVGVAWPGLGMSEQSCCNFEQQPLSVLVLGDERAVEVPNDRTRPFFGANAVDVLATERRHLLLTGCSETKDVDVAECCCGC
jgi:hypothetical protein